MDGVMSVEYEKAARLFVEAEEIDFAVKYFREAAYCALEKDDHIRSAKCSAVAQNLEDLCNTVL